MSRNFDRFQESQPWEERDLEAELERELEKADRWQDEQIDRDAGEKD